MDICFAFASWLCLYSLKKLIFPEDEFLFQYTVIFFLPIVKGKQEQQQQQKMQLPWKQICISPLEDVKPLS